MRRWLLFAFCCFWTVAAFGADIIVCGSGGTPDYSKKFLDWGNRLQKLLVETLDHPPAAVRLLTEQGSDGDASDLENLRRVFANLAKTHSPDEDLFVYLIGHGSFLRDRSTFQIPGSDLTAAELKRLIDAVPARRVVVINGASASAGFINEISGKDRVVAAATKSVREQNATEFMEFLLQSLADGSADRNRDERISVWEACTQASALTHAWYTGNGLIATEHAILDDNADRMGTRLGEADPGRPPAPLDGRVAKRVFIKDFSFPDSVPAELVQSYLALIERVEQRRDRKDQLGSAEYYRLLESDMLEAAKLHRKIRQLSAKDP